jgi:hypothetical protein
VMEVGNDTKVQDQQVLDDRSLGKEDKVGVGAFDAVTKDCSIRYSPFSTSSILS